MTVRMVRGTRHPGAHVKGPGLPIHDAQSAMVLIAEVWHTAHCDQMLVDKAAVNEVFFDLCTGVAGEVLQKFSNYQARLAMIGDFQGYQSKSLAAFIAECNRSGHIPFPADEAEALRRLGL